MDLKEFVKKSINEVDKALYEISEENTDYKYNYWINENWQKSLDFEVQVYIENSGSKNWEAGINVAWIKIWADWKASSKNYNLSKIKFSIVKNSKIEEKLKPVSVKN